MNAVELSLRRTDDCSVLLFPIASNLLWKSFLSQVPNEEQVFGPHFMDMSHQSLFFPSDVFRESQLYSPTVDKESLLTLSVFERVLRLLWDLSYTLCNTAT